MALGLNERIDALQRAAGDGTPGAANAADLAVHRWNWYVRQLDKIKGAQSNRTQVQEVSSLQGRAAGMYATDMGRRLRLIRGWCVDAGLLTADQAASIEVQCPPHEGLAKAQRRAAEEGANLRAQMQVVLEHAKDRSEALQWYNRSALPLSQHKINAWVRDLVTQRLLGAEWIAGARMGSRLAELAAKMRAGTWANKMANPVTENK